MTAMTVVTEYNDNVKIKAPHFKLCAELFLEQTTGIEPAPSAWEAEVLPLNHVCIF